MPKTSYTWLSPRASAGWTICADYGNAIGATGSTSARRFSDNCGISVRTIAVGLFTTIDSLIRPVALEHAVNGQVHEPVVDPFRFTLDAFGNESEPLGDGTAPVVVLACLDFDPVHAHF